MNQRRNNSVVINRSSRGYSNERNELLLGGPFEEDLPVSSMSKEFLRGGSVVERDTIGSPLMIVQRTRISELKERT